MLVLSRMPGEKIVISDDITVCVVGIQAGKVRLGFEAPRDVTILRSELLDFNPRQSKSRAMQSARPNYAVQDRSLYS